MTDGDLDEAISRCFTSPDDPAALADFDRVFRPLVSITLLRLSKRDPSMVEDAYQTAFVRYINLFRQPRDEKRNYPNYFLAIAKNALMDEYRRAARFVNPEAILSDQSSPPTRDVVDRIALFEAMTQLSSRCNYVLESFYLAEMPAPELARRLGVDVKSVYVIVQRCRERLRRLLAGKAPPC